MRKYRFCKNNIGRCDPFKCERFNTTNSNFECVLGKFSDDMLIKEFGLEYVRKYIGEDKYTQTKLVRLLEGKPLWTK